MQQQKSHYIIKREKVTLKTGYINNKRENVIAAKKNNYL